jgi:GDP-L-fucose synthase
MKRVLMQRVAGETISDTTTHTRSISSVGARSIARNGLLNRTGRVYIAGHNGLVGSSLWRQFRAEGFEDLHGKSSSELDLRDRDAVFSYFAETKPDYVVLAAAKVGGILANDTYPVDFLSDNLRIQTNVMDAALEQKVDRLLFLGSSCIYPKAAEQPIKERSLLTGHLEPTNEAYAIAKIAGILGVQAVRRQYGLRWISAMPTNLYGPGDNFSPTGSHVLPALIRRYDEAVLSGSPVVTNWGTGSPRREFLHVDDMAAACLHLLDSYDGPEHVNVGTGRDATIAEIAAVVAETVGFTGTTLWDPTKPDGMSQKRLDVGKLRSLGWESKIGLREGLQSTVDWYRQNTGLLRSA